MKEGFEALSRGDIQRGKAIFAREADAGNQYARMLLSRAMLHGYYGIQRNKARAHDGFYCIASQGYAPAAAECFRHLLMDDVDVQAFTDCVQHSGNNYALGVSAILAGVLLDDPQRNADGQALIEEAAATDPPWVGEAELAAADATWSEELQARAATFGFADAQLACGDVEAAARQYYTPALLLSENTAFFVRGVMQRLVEENDSMGITCDEEWEERWLKSSNRDRFIMAKLAEHWRLPFYASRELYRKCRRYQSHVVAAWMLALGPKARAVREGQRTLLGRDLVRLLGQTLWELFDIPPPP